MSSDDVLTKVAKYGKLIKRREKISHALNRLDDVDMTLDILSATNIGRYVNRLCDDPDYGRDASRIIEKWKEVARQSGVRGGEDDGSSDEGDDRSSKRVGLLNGVKEIVAKRRDHRDDSRERDDYESYSSKHHSRHEAKRSYDDEDEEYNSKKSRYDSQDDSDDCGRRRRSDDEKKKRPREHKYDGGDRRRDDSDEEKWKNKEAEKERTHKKKKKNKVDPSQRWGDKVYEHHHVNNNGEYEVGSYPSLERITDEKPFISSDHDRSSGELTDSSEITTEVSPKYREASSSSEKSSVKNSLKEPPYSDMSSAKNSFAEPLYSDSSVRMSFMDSPFSEKSSTKKSCSSAISLSSSRSSASSSMKESLQSSSSSMSNTSQKSQSSSTSSKEQKKSKKPTNNDMTAFDMMLQSADSTSSKNKKKGDSSRKWADVPLTFSDGPLIMPPFSLNNYQPFPQAFRTEKEKAAAVPLVYYAEYITFDVLKPMLEKCNAEDLAFIESKHDYLEEESGDLWQRHVTKKYPGEEPENGDSWKDLYFYLEKERAEKLKRLSERIGKNHQNDATKGHRKAILADAAAPSHIRRRQIAHGTTHSTRALPSAIEISSARRRIFETGGCKDELAALPKAVVNKNSKVGAKMDRGPPKKGPVKKGALMIKTMKMLNMKRK
ncbi:unnamed protein product [Nippostrongylus brasiliensis]|uniref:Transcription elongation factor B polypeptide 3 (inferred by orthology to a C. elegans protein) n=1 Tax=Nippostrongylus brasiliensis TaxID=27835 RepID=A0A0N4XZG1_NIPBR|nr:unnamed protein product [Nippostrongylus brasiliensis]